MAIEFNCPYCTAPIRVPDSAGGKRGTCPRCKTRILVPTLRVKSAATGGSRAASAASPKGKKKTSRQRLKQPLAEEPDFSAFPDDSRESDSAAAAPLETPSVFLGEGRGVETAALASISAAARPVDASSSPVLARVRRRRGRRRRYVWVPLVCGVLLVGGVAAVMLFFRRPKLEGSLEATAVLNADLKPRTIDPPRVDAKKGEMAAVLRLLGEYRRFARFSVTAVPDDSPTALLVRVHEVSDLRFVRVDLSQDPALVRYLRENGAKLDRPRRQEYNRALKRFFDEATQILAGGGSLPTHRLKDFQNQVLANALVGAEGYHFIAVAEGTAYPCAYQDGFRLYYLLPAGIKSFTLRGRTMADGRRLFPGRYFVEVKGNVPQKARSAEPHPAGSEDSTTP